MPEPRKTSKRQRLSEEERKRLWRKAVMAKAKQIKNLADVVILLMLAAVLGAHALPFVKGGQKLKTYDGYGAPRHDVIEQKRGYEIMLQLLTPYEGTPEDFRETGVGLWAERLPEPPKLLLGTQPRMLYGQDPGDGTLLCWPSGEPMLRFRNVYPATIFAYFILLVPIGAVVVLVLYLLDYKLWMGRFLPLVSCVYGFASVLYLMMTRVPAQGAWNALRYGSGLAWYLLLIPLFLVGSFSLLRLIVSQRWKRYVWAGLEIPEHLKPAEPEKDKEEEGKEKGKAPRRGRLAAAKAAAGPGKDKKDKDKKGRGDKAEKAKEIGESKESGEGKEPDAPKEGGAESAEAEGSADADKGEAAGDEKAQEGEKAGEAGEGEKE